MDQMKMINAGTVFYKGPVVELIVVNWPLKDKFNLLHQIKKEDEKRTQGSTCPMSGWQESIERAFKNQQNICDEFNCRYMSHKFRRINGEQCVLPAKWLKTTQLAKFKQLLQLCPNLTGIHIMDGDRLCQEFVNERIFNVMLTQSLPKLTSLTFQVELKSKNKKLMEFLRKANGRMEFIDDIFLKSDYGIELMESNPDLRRISTTDLGMDFELKELSITNHVLNQLSPSGSIVGLCSYIQKFNSNYRKSSANGIWLKDFELNDSVSALHYNELLNSFVDLDCLALTFNPEDFHESFNIGQLKVMKNMKILKLWFEGEVLDLTDRIVELLPNFRKLEELELNYVFISESTLQQLHVMCPHLKSLSINQTTFAKQSLTKETLRSILKLSKLKYFYHESLTDSHCWVYEQVEENR